MTKIFDSLKRNWLIVVLVSIIVVFLTRQSPITLLGRRAVFDSSAGVGMPELVKTGGMGMMLPSPSPIFEAPPVSQTDRLVVTNTNLSLKVSDVRKAIDDISAEAIRLGGFMVDSSLNAPEGPATGQISVRIPADKLAEGLKAIRNFGVKVVSENVVGTDVTSEFVDLEARLGTLVKTKAKFDQILASASEISDILSVQREIVNLQAQIDAIRGQQKYLEQTARLSLVTVYLATDELGLPFTPDEAWRPGAIVKEAVRSLIQSVRGVGTALIWVAVYAPIWLILLLVFWWWKRMADKG